MSTSAVPAILYTLRELVAAAVPATVTRTVDGATVTSDRQVLLGAAQQADDTREAVYVGWSADPNDLTMARFAQAWAGLGAKRKNEPVTVPCSVVVWSGDDDPGALAVLLDAAFVLFGLVETALRTDPGLGRPGPFVASIVDGQVVPDLAAGRLRLPFTVSVTYSRI